MIDPRLNYIQISDSEFIVEIYILHDRFSD